MCEGRSGRECAEVCWGVGVGERRSGVVGRGVGKCWERYGEVCGGVGEVRGGVGECVGKCVGVGEGRCGRNCGEVVCWEGERKCEERFGV